MSQNKFNQYPLPDWLQSYMEQNIGKVPIWKFPSIPKMSEGIYFRPLTFRNRFHFLELFEQDKDPWVDVRFKKAKSIYELSLIHI